MRFINGIQQQKFQKNWDIEAVDFYNMLNKALVDYVQTPLAKVANNLICSNNFLSKECIVRVCKKRIKIQ